MVRRDRIRTEHPIFGPDTRLKQKSIPHSSPLSSPMEFWREMTKIIGQKYSPGGFCPYLGPTATPTPPIFHFLDPVVFTLCCGKAHALLIFPPNFIYQYVRSFDIFERLLPRHMCFEFPTFLDPTPKILGRRGAWCHPEKILQQVETLMLRQSACVFRSVRDTQCAAGSVVIERSQNSRTMNTGTRTARC